MYVCKNVHTYKRVNGGAVAIGHPFGMTDARQVSTYVCMYMYTIKFRQSSD
jgi:acetyl-CoA acetyltransferase